jgi:alkylated DNA repair dioxygenase AlkB
MEKLSQTKLGEDAYLDCYRITDLSQLETSHNYTKGRLTIEPTIQLFGKPVAQPRNVGFFSDESLGYRYSRQLMPSQALDESLRELLRVVNTALGSQFNGILVNHYENGTKNIGAHSDDEAGLDAVGVAAISWGATRTLRFRSKATKKILLDFPLQHGEMVVMRGQDFQKNFTHEIPRQLRIKEPRWSFTFRHHLE